MGWVVGSVSSRGLTPAALVEPVAVTVHLEDVDVVGEAIEERAGEALGAEHLGPFVEGQIGGDQGRAPLVIFGGLRSLTWSIQMPKRSASAARLSLVASNSVSNRPIWLVDAPPRSTALPPTIHRIAGSRPSRSASFTSSYPARRP